MATDADTTTAVLGLVGILLGIAIPVVIFWLLIIWCSRRKRKRIAEFEGTTAAPDPVAANLDAATVAAIAPPVDPDVEKGTGTGTGGDKEKEKSGMGGLKSGMSDVESEKTCKTGTGKTGKTGTTGTTGTGTTGTTGTDLKTGTEGKTKREEKTGTGKK